MIPAIMRVAQHQTTTAASVPLAFRQKTSKPLVCKAYCSKANLLNLQGNMLTNKESVQALFCQIVYSMLEICKPLPE